MTEIFKDIPNYEGLYQVSNLGNVKSLPKGDGNGNRTRLLKQEIISANHTSYRRVTLSKEGKVKRFQVHRLVALVFLSNPEDKPHVNHIDNDGSNNIVTNLEWCTAQENMAHSSSQSRQDLPRKLGGIASGAQRREKAISEGKQRIGEVHGQLTIIDCFFDNTMNRPRFKYKCQCSCGNTTDVLKYDFEKSIQACRDCKYKIRGEARKSNKIKI